MIIHAGIVLKWRNEFKRYVVIHETRFFISVTKEIQLKIIDLNKSNFWPLEAVLCHAPLTIALFLWSVCRYVWQRDKWFSGYGRFI